MSENIIEFRGVNVEFSGYKALTDLNLDIEVGQFISVVGPNGAGKSTLLKILLGLVQTSSGDVNIFGSPLNEKNLKKIGYVPQVKTLERSFPAVAIDLVAAGLRGTWPGKLKAEEQAKCLDALSKVGAAHLANRSLSNLSGGELQRVYIARAFVREPELLILDEPVTGVDHNAEKDIHHIIDEYNHDASATVILVTHDWEAAYHHSDKVLLLNNRIICFGTPKEAFCADNMRGAFEHVGHKHEMIFGVHHHD